jgi:hypothetical protein
MVCFPVFALLLLMFFSDCGGGIVHQKNGYWEWVLVFSIFGFPL